MNPVRRGAVWCFMLTKRLLKKPGFAVILIMIPMIAVLFSTLSSGESGIVKIAVAAQTPSDAAARDVIDSLTNEDSVVLFSVYDSEKGASEAVASGDADAAWIILDDLENRAREYAKNRQGDIKLCRIVQRENDIFLKMSAEKLYGAVYKYIARPIYENFLENFFDSELSDEEMSYYSDKVSFGGNVVEFENLGGTSSEAHSKILTSPIRGLLMTVVLISGLASEMFLIDGERDGAFSRVRGKYRILVSLASDISALSLASAAALISLFLTGAADNSFAGILSEVAAAVGYVLICAPICALAGLVLRSPAILGAAIPVIAAASVIVCPVFIDIGAPYLIRGSFPLFYYLKALRDTSFIFPMIIYGSAAYAFALFLSFLRRQRYKA